MKNKIIRLDPVTLPAIKYCRKHDYFINLTPSCQPDLKGRFRVTCPDCGAFGPWKKTVKDAIIAWNHGYATDMQLR